MQAAARQPAGFADREEAFDESVAVVGLGAVALFAPQDRVPRALSAVLLVAGTPGVVVNVHSAFRVRAARAEAAGLGVAAAGSLLEQVVQLLAVTGQVGA